MSYFELVQNQQNFYWGEEEVQKKLRGIMCDAWHAVRDNSVKFNCSYREAAFITAMKRLESAIKLRRGN